MGRAGRARAIELCSQDRVTAATLEAYGLPAPQLPLPLAA
jgi:hypothetical protein